MQKRFLTFNVFMSLLSMSLLIGCATSVQTPETTATATEPPLPTPTIEPPATVIISETGDHSLTLLWQSEFSPEGALASPSDMVVDDLGNVYVSTQSVKNIKKFDKNGRFITQWGGHGGGDGQFNLAAGIALDTDNNVYVVDFFNARIQKFDDTGNFLLSWPTRGSPASLGIDQAGHVYLDIFFRSEFHIQKFDTSGTLLKEWGTQGEEDGQFSATSNAGPEDVAIDKEGYIYVADRVNHRVQKFDPDGNFVTKFGGEASTAGYGLFSDPRGVAVDPDGNLYVLDSYFLQKLDAQGNFITQWPINEQDPLYRASILALDNENNLYTFAIGDVITADGEPYRAVVLKKFSLR